MDVTTDAMTTHPVQCVPQNPQHHIPKSDLDAIIYVPALSFGVGMIGQSHKDLADRIALSCDRNANTINAQFKAELLTDEQGIPNPSKQQVYRISRKDKGHPSLKAFLDIYRFDYDDHLTGSYQNENLLIKTFRLLLIIIRDIKKIISATFLILSSMLYRVLIVSAPAWLKKNIRKEIDAHEWVKNKVEYREVKSWNELLQILYALFILCLSILYFILLILAIYDVVDRLLKSQPSLGISIPEIKNSQIFTIAFIVSSLIEGFIPDLKMIFTKLATGYIAIMEYLTLGLNRNLITGNLSQLIESVAEEGYKNVYLVSYSFGTVIALDSLFPFDHPPTKRYQKIHTLVTIGCPFDLIRLFWKHYFTRRNRLGSTPQRWINVYSPLDILSSNFRDDDLRSTQTQHTLELYCEECEKQQNNHEYYEHTCTKSHMLMPENIIYSSGLSRKNTSLLDWFLLVGVRSHTMYWDRKFQGEHNCFDLIIPSIYEQNNSEILK